MRFSKSHLRPIWAIVCFCSAAVGGYVPYVAQAQTSTNSWTTTFNTDVRYYGWTNSLGGSGAQIYAPLAAQLSGRPNSDWKLDFLLRSGMIWSRQSTSSASSEVSTPTDTNFTPTVTYLGWNGITPFAAVAFNLPTANKASNPNTTVSNTKTDPDIIATPVFGEGFNVGPSIGANFNLSQSMVVGLGAGYTYRGPFDQSKNRSLSRFDPGDVYTLNASFGYSGDQLIVQTSVSYSIENRTLQDSSPLYRAGPRTIASLKAGYTWNDNWASRLGVTYSHFEKNDVTSTGVTGLVRETFNSNSDVVKASFDIPYSRDNYTVGPTVGYLYRNRNGYDPTTFQFLPAKTSWNAGLTGTIAVNKQYTLNLSVQHIWVKENENPTKLDATNTIIPGSGVPESSTNAWVASIGGSVKF